MLHPHLLSAMLCRQQCADDAQQNRSCTHCSKSIFCLRYFQTADGVQKNGSHTHRSKQVFYLPHFQTFYLLYFQRADGVQQNRSCTYCSKHIFYLLYSLWCAAERNQLQSPASNAGPCIACLRPTSVKSKGNVLGSSMELYRHQLFPSVKSPQSQSCPRAAWLDKKATIDIHLGIQRC